MEDINSLEGHLLETGLVKGVCTIPERRIPQTDKVLRIDLQRMSKLTWSNE